MKRLLAALAVLVGLASPAAAQISSQYTNYPQNTPLPLPFCMYAELFPFGSAQNSAFCPSTVQSLAAGFGLAPITSVSTGLNLSGSGVLTATGGSSGITVNSTTITGGTPGNIGYNNSNTYGEETLTAALDAAFGTTQGSILYRGLSSWASLAPGTSGFFLETQGAAANPQWAAVSGGSGTVGNCSTTDALAYYASVGTTVGCLAGVGTSGQVLTSNGAGVAPTFQNATGGGNVSTSGSITNGTLPVWVTGTTISGTQLVSATAAANTVPISGGGNTLASGFIPAINLAGSGAGGVTGNLPNASLATQSANTVLGALTATTPSGLAVPSCVDSAGNHLNWTSGTGFSCGNTNSGGSTTITLSPGLAATPSIYNAGAQTVTNGSAISTQLFYKAESTSCTLNSTCNSPSTNDGGLLGTFTAGSQTLTAPNPGTVGSATYQWGYDGSHSYSVTTVGGSASIYGCGSSGTTITGIAYQIQLVSDGTNWQCIPSGAASGISGLTNNTVVKATSSTTIGNSSITDNGTLVTLSEPLSYSQIYGTPTALTDGATIATNAASGNWFTVTIAGNRTLSYPTGVPSGKRQNVLYEITQDGTGSRTLTLGSGFSPSSISLNPTAGSTTIFSCDLGNAAGTCMGGASGGTGNCSSSASPAVCGAATSGSVLIPAGAAQTLTIDTTAITADSTINVTYDQSATTGGTCNTTSPTVSIFAPLVVTARVVGTSFTVENPGTTTTNGACIDFHLN